MTAVANETTFDVAVDVRFTPAGIPLAVRHEGRIWAVAADPVHWFARDAWWETRRDAALGSADLVSIEYWRVQVRLGSNSALRTFELRRDPLSEQWLIRTVGLRAPRYAAFGWEPVVRNGDTNAGWTLIEFWIEDQGDALVSLRVPESGFSWAGLTDEQRRDVLEGNAEGWEAALEAARSFLEHP